MELVEMVRHLPPVLEPRAPLAGIMFSSSGLSRECCGIAFKGFQSFQGTLDIITQTIHIPFTYVKPIVTATSATSHVSTTTMTLLAMM